jgi:hypothetical protein
MFDVLLALNGSNDRRIDLEVDQAMNVIALGMAVGDAVLVLVDAPYEIAVTPM